MKGLSLYGVHAVREALRAKDRRCDKLVIARGRRDVDDLIALARARGIVVAFEESAKMDRMAAGGRHQGVILYAEPPKVLTLEDLLAAQEPGPQTLWAGLDEITDPQNLGAIIRSASCLGVSAVLMPDRRSAPITPTVEKAAAGAMDRVNLVDVGNLNQAVLKLKEKGFWVYGAAVEGRPVGEAQLKGPILLLIGSEGSGLREKTRGHCDELVRIPQAASGVQSLNASCAAAVLFYEFSRKLQVPLK